MLVTNNSDIHVYVGICVYLDTGIYQKSARTSYMCSWISNG